MGQPKGTPSAGLYTRVQRYRILHKALGSTWCKASEYARGVVHKDMQWLWAKMDEAERAELLAEGLGPLDD